MTGQAKREAEDRTGRDGAGERAGERADAAARGQLLMADTAEKSAGEISRRS